MPHHTPLIAIVAVGFMAALIFGLVANRLKLSPIVGYLAAGILVGPFTPGFVGDAKLAGELSEIGVILLMFGVGLHFSYRDLFAVKNIAIPGAVVQIGVATALGVGLATFLGWPLASGVVFGLALSVASTVVLLRALEERQLLDTRSGHIAVGWLIVEDIVMIFALVLLPVLAQVLAPNATGAGGESGSILGPLAITLAKLLVFIGLMFLVGRRAIPWLLARAASVGSRELFTLSVLAIGIGIAFGAAALFDVSFALGAFFAGMVLRESDLSAKAAEDTLPLRDAFAVLFFVSVGMLFDPRVLLEQPIAVLATYLIIVVGKSAAAYAIVRLFRHPSDTALLIAASLSQIGEFSFMLITLGVSLGLLPEAGRDLVLAGAILSITTNPTIFLIARKVGDMRRNRAGLESVSLDDPGDPLHVSDKNHVILIGMGRVGTMVSQKLIAEGIPQVVIELILDRVRDLRAAGRVAILGNATRADVLRAAGVETATHLVVAVPDALEAGEIVARARQINPKLRILARANRESEIAHILKRGADRVIMGEQEIARLMVEDMKAPA